jgi:Holliday junction resolvasome RuvABC endonuclease subunit
MVAKKNSFGSGTADKSQVAEGLLNIFQSNKESYKLIKELTESGKDDILDAISLALAASIKPRLAENKRGR